MFAVVPFPVVSMNISSCHLFDGLPKCFLPLASYGLVSFEMFFFFYICKYKACPSESGTEVGAPLFPAVELCDFSGRWQCMSGEIWYTLDSGSMLLTETEAR